MHEISLASRLVAQAEAAARDAGAVEVRSVRVRLGALAGVDPESLRFAYGIAVSDTVLAGASLEIEHLPVLVACPACGQITTLKDSQSFRCAACGTPTGDIRQGRELELVSLEVVDHVPSS